MKTELVAALSILFDYPSDEQEPYLSKFAEFRAYWLQTPPEKRRQIYVETFDFSKDVTLYLSYAQFGDTRERGMALADLKEIYRSAGFELAKEELPDYLPLILDFCSQAPKRDAYKALAQVRGGIEVLLRALQAKNSPYAKLCEALIRQIPSTDKSQRSVAEKFQEQGPPVELVGR